MPIMGQYLYVANKNHPRSISDGYVYVHVLEAEKVLGRSLKDKEVVHHKDLNKLNNDHDNLLVFASISDHTRFHSLGCRPELLIKNVDGSYSCRRSEKQIKKEVCALCGGIKDKCADMCLSCWRKKAAMNIPNRDLLQQKIDEYNGVFTKVAEYFNVTDNTVRKWCKKYGMEYHSRAYRKEVNL